jgi:two-component system chemotaxis response regulator CheY
MEPLDGIEFVERLRALRDPVAKKIPVIFMTVDASPATLRSALPLGISGFIVKPPRLNDLQIKIAAALA